MNATNSRRPPPTSALERAETERRGKDVTDVPPTANSPLDKELLTILASRSGAMDEETLEFVTRAATAGQDEQALDELPLSKRQMREIHAYIEANLANDIRNEGIAGHIGMSRTQFARRFKATTGTPPHQFVTDVRIRLATTLLADDDMSLADIAARTGFANPSHFATAFRRRMKISPSTYRSQFAKGGGPKEAGGAKPAEPAKVQASLVAMPPVSEFQLEQTSLRISDKVHLLKSSQGLGWTDLFVAETAEVPHQGPRGVVPAVWIVTADTPNDIDRIDSAYVHFRQLLPEQAISITPAGEAVYDELALPLKAQHFYLRQGLVDDVAEEIFRDGRERRFIRPSFGMDDVILRRLIATIRTSLDEPAAGNRLKMDYLTQALAAHLLTRHSIVGAPPPAYTAGVFNSRQLGLISDYIGDNLSSDLGIDELAGLVGLGRTQFIRRFKATMRIPPHRFVILRRIKEARKLLANPSIDSAAIACACGFADQSHFTSTFRKIVGLTPGEYRKLILS